MFKLYIKGKVISDPNLKKTVSKSKRIKENFHNIEPVALDFIFKLENSEKMRNEFVIIDFRQKAYFEKDHLKKAINIDATNDYFEDLISILDKGKQYLVYGSDTEETEKVIQIFDQYKFENKILFMKEGFKEWLEYKRKIKRNK